MAKEADVSDLSRDESVAEATERALKAASHLTATDAGAVAALRALARKIDAWDVIVEWAIDDTRSPDDRPKVPQNDNVTLPTYLKFCDALGLTPAGRTKLGEKKEPAVGTLGAVRQSAGKLRSVQ